MSTKTSFHPSDALVLPKIVRCGEMSTISIQKTSRQAGFDTSAEYRATLYPSEELDSPIWDWKGPTLPMQVQDGTLTLKADFPREQRYLIVVEKVQGKQVEPVGEFAIYALADDLYERLPFKGDMHMHSNKSDGVETPAYVAAMCRKIGLDFMALTDHGQYAPSLEAQQAFREAPIDLRIYPGEEVHPPENPIHIVNFGGSYSINELFERDGYREEVSRLQAKLGKPPAGANPYWYASSVWCFEKIRQAGGLGIFCHPYWFANRMIRIPESLTTALLETQPYDALELIGGYFRKEAWSNNWQVSRYYQETAGGRRIPIVGVSDAHGCHRDLFGWYYTIVLAPSTDLEDLITSIKAGYSVAVEAIAGETVHVYGPFRLVKYAHFLIAEVFPALDALCREEGDAMIAYHYGKSGAVEQLRQMQGKTGRLRQLLCRGN